MPKNAVRESKLAEPGALRKAPQHGTLKPQSGYLAEVISHSPSDAVMVIDSAFRIIALNEASAKLTGLHKDRALGMQCHAVCPCANGTNPREVGNQCPFGDRIGLPRNEQLYTFTNVDGKNITMSMTHTPIFLLDSEEEHQLIVIHKVNTRKRMQRNKSDIIAEVSHELLAPLNLIRGYAATVSNLEGTLTAEQRRRYLQAIESSTFSLTQLIRSLLDLPRLESGSLRTSLEVGSLDKLLSRVISAMQIRYVDNVIKLRVSTALPLVRMDLQKIEQVVVNLVDNAIKYSPRGSEIEVMVQSACDKKQLTKIVGKQSPVKPPCLIVSVRDSGIGIDEAELGLIFEKYYRVHNRFRDKVNGLGLGLYLCKLIVESHGGHIWTRSRVGNGSTFYFSLPVYQPIPRGQR